LPSAHERQGHGAKRSALLRLAIISSAVSKLFGFALQAISIPLIYNALGQHRYALFLLLTGGLATIVAVQMGAGPGLTQGLAKANAAGDREREASLFAAALRVFAVAALITGSALICVVHLVSPAWLFGPAFASDQREIWADVNVCALVLGLQVLTGVVDSALAGYQEQVFIYLGSAVANVACIGLLVLVFQHSPSVIAIILTLYGAPMVPRAINLVLLARRKPYLFRGLLRSCRGTYGLLLNTGLGFWGIEIGSMLEQNCGNYELAHLSSVQATALFAVAYKGIVLAGAVVSTITTPLWPAYTDAIAHQDGDWIRRSHRSIRRAVMAYACVVSLFIIVAGQWTFTHILHVNMTGNGLLFTILGVYFIASIWTHLLYVTLMGIENIWKVAVVVFTENVLMLLFGLVFVPHMGAAGMALAYLCASLVLPAWLLPRMLRQAIGKMAFSLAPSTGRT